MKTLNLKMGVLVSLVALALAGCGGSSRPTGAESASSKSGTSQAPAGSYSQSQPSGDDFAAESAPPPADAAGEEARAEKSSSAPAPAAAGAGTSAPRQEAKRRALETEDERPGLGTVFGETRTSRVSSAPFERNSPNSPFAVSAISYNDRSGINAMLRGASLADFHSDGVNAARGFVTVRLIDENGTPLPTMASGGRNFVMGEHGQHYSIELTNRTNLRFEAVVTVDGLDVIDGRPGAVSKRGYLLQPFATVEIDGFRQSMDEVASFRFGSVRNSYAGKKGDDRNVGVIGVAFFEERGANVAWTEREIERRNNANPFPGGFAEPPIAR